MVEVRTLNRTDGFSPLGPPVCPCHAETMNRLITITGEIMIHRLQERKTSPASPFKLASFRSLS